MDMSVTVSPKADAASAEAQSKTITRGANASDLDLWLEKVEAMGELKRITAEVDPDLEAATITYLVGSEKSPALLFENIKGHPGHKALYNMIGCNLSRFCLMIGEEPVDHPLKAVQLLQQKLGRKMAPVEVPAAQRDLQPEHRRGRQDRHPHVPGAAHVAARRRHISRHRRRGDHEGSGDRPHQRRHLPHDDQGPARDRRLHVARQGRRPSTARSGGRWASRCRSRPPTASIRCCSWSAATSLPKTESEYEYYSGIKGAPIELFTSDLTGLPLPARAEIILEGILYPDETFAEGPFGEFTGYYGRPSGATPYMRVERVRYRDNPTLTCALMADGAVERVRPVLGGAALGRHLGRPAEARRAGHPGRVVDPGGRRLGHHGGLDQADVCRPRPAGDGARRAMHRRRLFRQIRHRGRRRRRSDQRRTRCCGRWRRARGRRSRSTSCARPGAPFSIRASTRRRSGRGARRR